LIPPRSAWPDRTPTCLYPRQRRACHPLHANVPTHVSVARSHANVPTHVSVARPTLAWIHANVAPNTPTCSATLAWVSHVNVPDGVCNVHLLGKLKPP